jgi:ubiquinone/menaquinone biosynthesis C-methylase UbiE
MIVVDAVRNWLDLEKSLLESGIRSIANHAHGRMLDVGCGDKPYRKLFAPHVTEHLGIDYADTFNESVWAKEHEHHADFVFAGERLPFDDAEFDTILCTQVLEHTAKPWVLFAEMTRVLKAGGVLILTIPFSYRLHSEPYDFYRYTHYGLRALSEQHGLDVVKLFPRGGFWAVIGQKLASYLVLTVGRMAGQIQQMGGFGYEKKITVRPRYLALPFVIPALFAVVAICRFLDRVAFSDNDTLGYFLVARKTGVPAT